MHEPNDEMVGLAAARLGISKSAARSGAKPVAGIEGAFFFTRGTRGGGRLLVSESLETLFAASIVLSSAVVPSAFVIFT